MHHDPLAFTRPGGGETSGGSLRSSRQAGVCHPFTRPWAAMPPEASPPPGLLPAHGLSVNVFQDDTFDVARKYLYVRCFVIFRVRKKITLKTANLL